MKGLLSTSFFLYLGRYSVTGSPSGIKNVKTEQGQNNLLYIFAITP
jgi:hypothetical protein